MAKLDLSGISKLGGYLLANEGPLDVRTVVKEYGHLAELVSSRIAYVGMVVYVNSGDTNKGLYVCESNTSGGSWKLINNSSEVDTIIQEYLKSKQDVITDLDTIRSGAAKGATALQSHQSLDHKQDVITDLATIRAGAAKGATALQAHQSLDHKQDVITDLETIRSGASKGATAVQPGDLSDYALKTDVSSIQLLDSSVKLSNNLYTNYNIGRIKNATESSPVLIGEKDWTIRQMFENIFTAKADTPTTTAPSLSLTLSNNSSSLEYGKEVTISATITASTGRLNSSYYSGGYTTSTGVSWSTLNLESTNSTFTTKTSGITSGSSFTVPTTSKYYAVASGGTIKGKASAPSGYTSSGITAKNNLGQDTDVKIASSTSRKESSEATTSVGAGYVPYTYILSASLPTSLPTSNRSKNKPTSISVSGGSDSTYLYIFVPSSSSISTIKSGGFGVPFTLVESSKSYTVNNSKATTFKVYKTDSTVVSNTFDIS